MITLDVNEPKVILLVGRRGSGKTYAARQIIDNFRRRGGVVLAIDPVASDPPKESHLASSADVWDSDMPEFVPVGITMVAVDEADMYAPQADARRRPPPPLVDLIRRGRHRGVTLVLCTQRPALVMRDAYALADYVVICQTTDARDLKTLCELPGVLEHRQAIINSATPGPVVIWSPPPTGVTVVR